MNFNKILEYQKNDLEKIKLEKTLSENINRQNVNKAVQLIKEAQNSTTKLDTDAKETITEFENILKAIEDNAKALENLKSVNVEKQTNEKLQEYSDATIGLASNFAILENKILAVAEKINTILGSFNNTKTKISTNKAKYDKDKEEYEKFAMGIKPQIEELKTKLEQLEKEIEPKLISIYKEKRQDKMFPVFVPELDNSCVGCGMALPAALLAKLNSQGYLECENCHRIIYKQD